MFASLTLLRNAQGAQSKGRAKEGKRSSAAKGIIKAGARKPRPYAASRMWTSEEFG
jgi:hypothetical protein